MGRKSKIKSQKSKLNPSKYHTPRQPSQSNYIVILAGGGGTRLWPKSRKNKPKQFLRLINNKTLLGETIKRVKNHFPYSQIFIVTSKELLNQTKKEAPAIPKENILIEPSPKNTAAAAGLAAAHIARSNPEAIVSTLAADHYIKEESEFLTSLSISQKAAGKGDFLVTMGIHPTHAHTSLGYIQTEGEIFKVGRDPVLKVESFKEKPNATLAAAYVASGEYFWNANINSYKTNSLLSAIKKFSPQLSQVLEKIKKGANVGEISNLWHKLPSEPIDTAILEKAKNVLMVAANFSWFDVGDWSTVSTILSRNPEKNVIIGDAKNFVSLNTKGSLIYTNKRLIAGIGLEDMIVIDTPDVLLICPKARSQEVKKIVEKLIEEKKEKFV